ncbi:hypothetical protein G9C98_003621 [Cotesia typhae]|uniref:Maspardin n=1 Tax=Cotesia typhae TaxID=2053667 RepID=A0A8J5R6Q7_9HYME|nr:hypothetical protein G9C98_003621 [Cotesia typhae]
MSYHNEYESFRSSIPLKKIIVDSDGTKGWRIYDSGPKNIKSPLICLPPVSGTADIFFKQILSLSAKGYRVISAESPVYWNINDWCCGFKKLLDYLELNKVHIFGASLENVSIDDEMIEAIDFMVERLESLSQSELASRLTINCVNSYVQPHKMGDLPITLIDVFDDYALSPFVREEMYKCYPNAKLGHLKNGGNFPYLSRSAEVNLHLQIHLRQFEGTEFSSRHF